MAASIKREFFSCPCDDILEFQEALRSERTTDDRIIHALNTSIPTTSFTGQVDATGTCKSLWEQLQQSHKERETAIKNCISQKSSRVTELRAEKSSDPDNATVMKNLRKEQISLRLMQSELNVEEVIKDRSLKVFNERCRTHYKPDHL